MPNYKEEIITGEFTRYRRVGSVAGYNVYGETPQLVFNEEDILFLPDGSKTVQDGVASITSTLDTPEEEFNIIHPVTGDIIGTAKKQDVYILLQSLYLHEAKKRDEAVPVGH